MWRSSGVLRISCLFSTVGAQSRDQYTTCMLRGPQARDNMALAFTLDSTWCHFEPSGKCKRHILLACNISHKPFHASTRHCSDIDYLKVRVIDVLENVKGVKTSVWCILRTDFSNFDGFYSRIRGAGQRAVTANERGIRKTTWHSKGRCCGS